MHYLAAGRARARARAGRRPRRPAPHTRNTQTYRGLKAAAGERPFYITFLPYCTVRASVAKAACREAQANCLPPTAMAGGSSFLSASVPVPRFYPHAASPSASSSFSACGVASPAALAPNGGSMAAVACLELGLQRHQVHSLMNV